ncbi:hypothetical protein LBMAG52_46080 [Planctomycetia bacterium]|nr:hypothetical protein LBMAG52_46080 [Planctomycetia bacterium]
MSRPGNNKIIKGKQSDQPGEGLVQAFSASGPDVWVTTADYKQPGVVISAVGARCGKTFIADGEWTAIANTHVLLPGKEVDARWLWYRTNDESFWIKAGAAQPFVKVKDTLQQLCKFPPLAEQRRIVGILDEAFEGLATGKANAEQNLQNARALFESHLQAVFTQRGDGWVERTLGEEIDLLAGFAFKSAQYTNRDQDVRLLRGDNIIQGCLRWDDVKKWPANDVDAYESYQLREGDIVLAMDRPWVKAGLKHATITADDLPCLLVQRTARLRGSAKLNNRFLMYLIGSAAFTRHILGVQTGIGVPHISGQQIKDFEFALPPMAEQRRIADNLEALREETQRLESLYQRKLAALDELKKSLLHRAFSGQL